MGKKSEKKVKKEKLVVEDDEGSNVSENPQKDSKKSKKRSLSESSAISVDEPAETPKQTSDEIPQESEEGKQENGEPSDPPKRKRKRKRKTKTATESETPTENVAEGGSQAQSTASGEQDTIYVEGLSYDAVEKDISDFFELVGKVKEVRLPRYHDSGKPRGYAHVVFDTAHAASQAIKDMNGQRLMGRYLKIAASNAKSSGSSRGPSQAHPSGCTSLFVKNLPYDCNEESLKQLMSTFGRVQDVRLAIARNGSHVRMKGFGYVQFADEAATIGAAKAANAGRLNLNGRGLIVDFETNARPKGSFRRPDGKLWRES